MSPDVINGLFETCGGLFCLLNVYRTRRDKAVKGVSVLATAFFASWGWWNLYYYPSLGQWMSFVGGVFLVLVNTVWVSQLIYYSKGAKDG